MTYLILISEVYIFNAPFVIHIHLRVVLGTGPFFLCQYDNFSLCQYGSFLNLYLELSVYSSLLIITVVVDHFGIMAISQQSLEDLYVNLTLEDEEEGGIIVEKSDALELKHTYVLVGKFLTKKNINFNVMQNVLTSLWRPKEGMEVHDLGGLRYSFVFYHKMDGQKVIDGGPWSFEQAMLILHQLKDGEDPYMVKLQDLEIWVQSL